MEKYEENRLSAQKKLQHADHMLLTTYPLLKDPKLLLAVLEHLAAAIDLIVSSVVLHARHTKQIPPYHDTPQVRSQLFCSQLATRHGIHAKYVEVVANVQNLLAEHRRSATEFSRQGNYVICSDQYLIKTLTTHTLKEYLNSAKELYALAAEIVTHHDVVPSRGQLRT